MSVAILYATKYGSTRRAAEAIAAGYRSRVGERADVLLAEITRSTTLPDADTVLVGSPIYGGSVPAAVAAFLDRELDALLARRAGLFLRCFYDGARAEQQLADNVPARLLAHSYGNYYLGGRIEVATLRWIDRILMRRLAKIEHDVDTTNEAEIARLVAEL